MKILLTGGGSGGHFYPVIAVAESINEISREEKLLQPDLFYMADQPYNPRLLYETNLKFKKTPSGKLRRYFSIKNFFDLFKTAWGMFKAIFQVFSIYPDVIFSKGGYSSFPALFAGRMFKIPIVIHESDIVPGRVNMWASKFAQKIAVSYPEAAEYFPIKVREKIAFTGNPIRKSLLKPLKTGAHEYLNLNDETPVIFFLGGSQGAKIMNDVLMTALPELVKHFQIIHQTGKANFEDTKNLSNVVLRDSQFKHNYKPFEYLDDLAMRMAAGASSVIVSRAGSTIFEIAAWGIPSIIIPISESNGDHQRKNAYAYARGGGGVVIEEKNLSSSILISEITRLVEDSEKRKIMAESALKFAKLDAGKKIARELIRIALKHES